jgi:hypothetical protein
VSELAGHSRLLEVGVGDRLGAARALADRGCDVVAIDIAVDPAGDGTSGGVSPGERAADTSASENAPPADDRDGSLVVRHGDVLALADAADPLTAVTEGASAGSRPDTQGVVDRAGDGFDAVYARRLPAELQSPTTRLARRIDAACVFTTLGFEEPVVPVERRSHSGATVYAWRGRRG